MLRTSFISTMNRHTPNAGIGFSNYTCLAGQNLPFYLSHLLVFPVKSIGCYRDTGRRAIPGRDGKDILLRDFYRRRADAITKCASVAMRFGYPVFAIQHGGWCATGPRAHVTYRKYGRSNRCRNGKGGPWANDVYRVYGELSLTYKAFHWFVKRFASRLKPGLVQNDSIVCV